MAKKVIEAKLPEEGLEPTIDINSPTWRFISNWVDKEIAKARERNDYLKLDEKQTTILRARIKTLKEIRTLAQG